MLRQRDLVPPPVPSIPDLVPPPVPSIPDHVTPPVPSVPHSISLPQPFAQPDDGPINGPKHVVVILL
jgi:hypothetical protein